MIGIVRCYLIAGAVVVGGVGFSQDAKDKSMSLRKKQIQEPGKSVLVDVTLGRKWAEIEESGTKAAALGVSASWMPLPKKQSGVFVGVGPDLSYTEYDQEEFSTDGFEDAELYYYQLGLQARVGASFGRIAPYLKLSQTLLSDGALEAKVDNEVLGLEDGSDITAKFKSKVEVTSFALALGTEVSITKNFGMIAEFVNAPNEELDFKDGEVEVRSGSKSAKFDLEDSDLDGEYKALMLGASASF